MSYFFSTPVDIDIVLEDTDERPTVDVKLDKNRREKAPLYLDGESVKGAVTIRPKDGKRLEHTGIKVQFVGTIGTLLVDARAEIGRRCRSELLDFLARALWLGQDIRRVPSSDTRPAGRREKDEEDLRPQAAWRMRH